MACPSIYLPNCLFSKKVDSLLPFSLKSAKQKTDTTEVVSLKSINNILTRKRSVSYYLLARCLFTLSLKSTKLSTSETDSLSVYLNPEKQEKLVSLEN